MNKITKCYSTTSSSTIISKSNSKSANLKLSSSDLEILKVGVKRSITTGTEGLQTWNNAFDLASDHLQLAKKRKVELKIASGLHGTLTLPAQSKVVCVTSWVALGSMYIQPCS